ncbi:MAG: hypothetical protein AB1641_16810 [Thermodesulfobacteriota bacterium]
MVRDKAFRIAALIGLCALVYYFSFDQGRQSQRERLAGLEQTLKAKERLAEGAAAEIKTLQEKLAKCRNELNPGSATGASEAEAARFNLRRGASRSFLEGRLLVSCLEINPGAKLALMQLNLVKEDKLLTQPLRLGQNLNFTLGGASYALILEQIHPSMITASVVRK